LRPFSGGRHCARRIDASNGAGERLDHLRPFYFFAPAHKGVFAPMWEAATGLLRFVPGSNAVTGYVFPSKEDLTRGSPFLQNLEQKYNTILRTEPGMGSLVTSKRTVFGSEERIVETDQFGSERTEYKIIRKKDHFTVCKPLKNSFMEPFEILTSELS
jgi:hypothetical protein